jgi:hypothetical protein
MAELLDHAYAAIAQLPKADQEAIAATILEEIASEDRWQQALARTPSELKKLADEAHQEHQAGKTLLLDPDGL